MGDGFIKKNMHKCDRSIETEVNAWVLRVH